MRKKTNSTAKKSDKSNQEKRSSLPYIAFLILLFVALISLKTLTKDKTSNQSPTPPAPDLSEVDSMVIKAIKVAEQRVKGTPSNARFWGELGITYWANELDEPGRKCIQKAQELDPGNGKWIYYRALTFLPENAVTAIPLVEKAADILDEQSYAPRLRLANILSEESLLDRAKPHYEKILQSYPDNPMAKLGLGRLAMAKGNTEEAIKHFEECKDHENTKKTANSALATLYLRADKPVLADTAQQAAEAIEGDVQWQDPYLREASRFKFGLTAWLDSAGKLVRRGQYTSALPIIDKIITNYPDEGKAYIYLAKIKLAAHQYKEAEQALVSALSYEPDSVEARVQLGVALMWQKRFKESITTLNKAIEQSPNLAEAHYNLGLSLASDNNLQKAADAFSTAIKLKPALPDSYIGLATVFLRAGQQREAKATLEKALNIAPRHPRITSMLKQLQ